MSHQNRQSRPAPERSKGQVGVGLLIGAVTLAVVATATRGLARVPHAQVNDTTQTFLNENVKPVVSALSRYAAGSDDNRLFPAAEDWVDNLCTHGLLPANALPPSPWKAEARWFQLGTPAGFRQANTPDWPQGLVDAAQLVRGARASAVGTVLGHGELPTHATFDATTYGALLYDVDPAGQVAVLYGVGQKGDQAVISSVETLGFANNAAMHIWRQPLKLVGTQYKVMEQQPNHDTLQWQLTLQNRASYEVPAYLTLIFEGGNEDDNLKVSGTRVDVPAGKTIQVTGDDTLAPGEAAKVRLIRCELDGKAI